MGVILFWDIYRRSSMEVTNSQLHLASSLAWRRSAAPTHPPCASLPGDGTDVDHLFKTQYVLMHGHEYTYIYI